MDGEMMTPKERLRAAQIEQERRYERGQKDLEYARERNQNKKHYPIYTDTRRIKKAKTYHDEPINTPEYYPTSSDAQKIKNGKIMFSLKYIAQKYFMKNNYAIVKIYVDFPEILILATDTSDNAIAWDSIDLNIRYGPEVLGVGYIYDRIREGCTYDRVRVNPRACYITYDEIALKLKKLGIEDVDIVFRGPRFIIDIAIKALLDNGINVNMVENKDHDYSKESRPLKRIR